MLYTLNPLRLLGVGALALAMSCATTTDMERSHLRDALASSEALAGEIENWRRGLNGNVPANVIETLNGFKARANAMLDTVAGTSDNATVGLDLAGVKQALTQLAEFDTSRLADASQNVRLTVLDQFVAHARNLDRAVDRLPPVG